MWCALHTFQLLRAVFVSPAVSTQPRQPHASIRWQVTGKLQVRAKINAKVEKDPQRILKVPTAHFDATCHVLIVLLSLQCALQSCPDKFLKHSASWLNVADALTFQYSWKAWICTVIMVAILSTASQHSSCARAFTSGWHQAYTRCSCFRWLLQHSSGWLLSRKTIMAQRQAASSDMSQAKQCLLGGSPWGACKSESHSWHSSGVQQPYVVPITSVSCVLYVQIHLMLAVLVYCASNLTQQHEIVMSVLLWHTVVMHHHAN